MTTIISRNADGQMRQDSVHQDNIAKTIKILQRKGQYDIRVIWNIMSKSMTLSELQHRYAYRRAQYEETKPSLFLSVGDIIKRDFSHLKANYPQRTNTKDWLAGKIKVWKLS